MRAGSFVAQEMGGGWGKQGVKRTLNRSTGAATTPRGILSAHAFGAMLKAAEERRAVAPFPPHAGIV